MDLGVVAERLKVAHSLHRGSNGLLVENAPGVHLNLHVEPLGDETF